MLHVHERYKVECLEVFESSLSLYPLLFCTSLPSLFVRMVCWDYSSAVPKFLHFKCVPQKLFIICPSSYTSIHLVIHDPKILALACSNCFRDLFHLNFLWFTHTQKETGREDNESLYRFSSYFKGQVCSVTEIQKKKKIMSWWLLHAVHLHSGFPLNLNNKNIVKQVLHYLY